MHNSSALMATAGAESEKNKANKKREKRKKAMAGVTLNQERDEQEEE